jgi:hypothetical protein
MKRFAKVPADPSSSKNLNSQPLTYRRNKRFVGFLVASVFVLNSVQNQFASDARMGETDTVMEYDESLIFKHLYAHHLVRRFVLLTCIRCFYLDTPSNARKNDMEAKSKHEETIKKKYVHFVQVNSH